jgi:hypothetical protein
VISGRRGIEKLPFYKENRFYIKYLQVIRKVVEGYLPKTISENDAENIADNRAGEAIKRTSDM